MGKIHEFRCGTGQQLHSLQLRFIKLSNVPLLQLLYKNDTNHRNKVNLPQAQQRRLAALNPHEEKRRVWSNGKESGAES